MFHFFCQAAVANLIRPQGDIEGDDQKFICIFHIGLEDDDDFCLVKRLLGRAGCNMRRIADSCNAKVRLRGNGSGFLEGTAQTMQIMRLLFAKEQFCFGPSTESTGPAISHLKAAHYPGSVGARRYARSKGIEIPDVKLALEEVRRDDWNINHFGVKGGRSPIELEARNRQSKEQRESAKWRMAEQHLQQPPETTESDSDSRMKTLPGGVPMPATPAGRRAACSCLSCCKKDTGKSCRHEVIRKCVHR
eukprot:symbB.v1.2.032372.t1/scaffold3883.1/size53558/4